MSYRITSLFAGIGGIDYGFENTGFFKTTEMVEIDKWAVEVLKHNFIDTNIIHDDIQNVDKSSMSSMDILLAGFPCQPFSIAGNQKGLEDERGNLFLDVYEIAKLHKPRVVFLENVKNLVSHDKGNTFKVITEAFENLGYHIKHKVLNTCEYSNLPQNRERIYLVCFKSKKDFKNFDFPEPIIRKNSIYDFLEENVENKYYYKNYPKIFNQINLDEIKENTAYQWRRIYLRENKSSVVPTLTANMGTGGHNVPLILDPNTKELRKLTPRECFNLQGFSTDMKIPKNISNGNLYKQSGNAVSVSVIERIALNIYDSLSKKN